PNYDRYLDENLFPSRILTEEALSASLAEERIAQIRNAIASPGTEHGGVSIRYMVPWFDDGIIEPGSVDVILSHAVLEHVADLEKTYRALSRWLKPGGMMSHQIDFKAHGLAKKWNGYRSYSEMLWRATVGRRPFLINRQPCSVHVDLMERNGFEIICLMKKHRSDGIARSQLSRRWRGISDDDLECSDVFVQARKR
ncbi:MAG: methyltransferase domain-containing protein, partial [Candidatus Krumholzibacteria bacterium]|nr:methyltransferase domain-containing protein [Candidatus Krumholzibacteria bacterium]